MSKIKLAIVGLGNCASSLVQGLEFYKSASEDTAGLMHEDIGGYRLSDVEIVAAFDVDARKVGKSVEEAIFAAPNNTTVFQKEVPATGVTVQMGPVLDGVAEHMANYPDSQAFRVADAKSVDVTKVLKETGAEVLVSYLPVGSEDAARHYAQCCIDAKVAMVNCLPVFIASHPEWAEKFRAAGVPIVGDDIKSQVGATIIHRALARLVGDRGAHLERTYQLNTGGNTDFLNMLNEERLKTKRISKTESVQSQLDRRLAPTDIHIGPSDYVAWQKDNKVCFLRMEWKGWGDVPMHIEARLSVEDSPNSAGVAIDAIRLAKLGLDRGIGGPLEQASAYLMKHPPKQMRDSEARELIEKFIAGE
ncbi:MAG: inositol-3-phosphate synthase [Myxococcales bacterium]|nr:inositol-3-phosphate synthase [Myxococcales bacterium]MCB9647632.1 inositol-3-phosphate synthase [Deltaproteobacteria bacterium]